MNKKLQLFCLTILSSIFFQCSLRAQSEACGTGAPSQQWDAWFNKLTDDYKQKMMAGKTTTVTHIIPVIVHVIYFNEALGTFPNIPGSQIISQIAVLNDDYAGVGLNSGNVPPYFAPLKANTGIKFCLTTKDQQDATMTSPGIERISTSANSWLSLSTPGLDVKAYMNSVIIPATIWDPNKYLNIWISDKPAGYASNGFATYPTGTGLTGLYGGNFGTSNNDGIWCWASAFGDAGSLTSPNDKGRTATHEIGHWLGLRHTWGDGNCLSDYCNDTPTSKQAHTGCLTSTPPDLCGTNQSPNGEMVMNFMDGTDDACMYMFTNEQNMRMQVAMSQCTNRYLLGTHNKCVPLPIPASTSSAVASFKLGNNQCLNSPFYPYNTSSGYPYPVYAWSASPAAIFLPNSTIPNPGITVTNPGTYTISLASTNSLSSSTYSYVINVTASCSALSPCIDTLKAIKKIDTLQAYPAPYSILVPSCISGNSGNLTGTNCYKDREFAQYFGPATYTGTPFPQVNSVIVLFDSLGTHGNPGTSISCKVYGGNVGYGPNGLLGTKVESLGSITSYTPKVLSIGYLGKPNFSPLTASKIIPFKYDFISPVIINPSSGFFVAVESPVNSFFDSIRIFSNTRYNSAIDSSAWFLSYNNTWRTFRSNRGYKVQLAMIPQITCSPIVGINEAKNDFTTNVMILPNPSNGLFNLVFTLSKQEDLSITIYNSMGQLVVASHLKNVSSNVINLDLSDKPDGIYFTEISNGQQKVVKKIVINH